MTTRIKPRSPSVVLVSPLTEWTDYPGIHLLFGLRRSTAYHLSNEGLIKSVSLAEHGERRGKRLFHVPSIREYLNSKTPERATGCCREKRELVRDVMSKPEEQPPDKKRHNREEAAHD